ncbi:type I restriction enzyme S subunit [Methanococcus maripaludis]|uniref:Type I restriction enzyme S subunit n=1 Tax=Methanococcus maripaludis TaxID=39152 RepID=A0A7J9P661_METMI|nr:restriction endonuclease subunit S [Methanococcus maripaludis]MBA2858701.1 type I restriction enzyme S subunit [Methanococcus maripaludis]
MDTEKLKEKILQLAIQGKLVRQNPDDEPASVLLDKIETEKQNLIKEKKIKKQKPIPGILEDEIPFKIPENWVWCRLGDIGEIYNGNSINSKLKEEKYLGVKEGYPYIGTKDVYADSITINYENGVKIPYSELKNFKIANEGSVLICAEGGNAGKKIGFLTENVTFGNKLLNFNGYNNIINRYVYYVFQSLYFYTYFTEYKTGIIGGISINKFKELPIPVPPLSEQKTIVQKLDDLFILMNNMENDKKKLLDVINLTRNKVLKLAVQGKLINQNPDDEPASVLLDKIETEKQNLIKEKKIKKQKPIPGILEDEIPFKIPENWVWCRLGTLVHSFQNGISKRSGKLGQETVVLRLADIKNNRINLEDTRRIVLDDVELNRYSLNTGDILITRVNGSADIVGSFTPVENVQDISYCDHFIRMKLFNEYIYPPYIVLLGKSELVRKKIKNLFITTAGQKTVNQTHISSIPVILPPLEEQQRIVQKVDELMKLCDELEQNIEKSKNYSEMLMQSVLQEAFKN